MKIASTNVKSVSTRKPVRFKRKEIFLCLLATFLLFCLIISPAAAKVTELKISPVKPCIGDTINVIGKASPGESVAAQVSLNQRVPVSGGRFVLPVNGINIPADTNTFFTATAFGVQNLHVQVKKFGIVISDTTVQASGGVATITKGPVIPGTYDVLIDGNALSGKSAVYVLITGSQTLTADSKGIFRTSVDTSAMPAGKYTIRVGNKQGTIQLRNCVQKINTVGIKDVPLLVNQARTSYINNALRSAQWVIMNLYPGF